jgi:hypothetical protein
LILDFVAPMFSQLVTRMFGKPVAVVRRFATPGVADDGPRPDPHPDPIANFALTIDRAEHVLTAQGFAREIVSGDARAGFLFLWGHTMHAPDAFALRLSNLAAEDAEDRLLSSIRVRSTARECGEEHFFELEGGRPIKSLAAWRQLLAPEGELQDLLGAASGQADL